MGLSQLHNLKKLNEPPVIRCKKKDLFDELKNKGKTLLTKIGHGDYLDEEFD